MPDDNPTAPTGARQHWWKRLLAMARALDEADISYDEIQDRRIARLEQQVAEIMTRSQTNGAASAQIPG